LKAKLQVISEIDQHFILEDMKSLLPSVNAWYNSLQNTQPFFYFLLCLNTFYVLLVSGVKSWSRTLMLERILKAFDKMVLKFMLFPRLNEILVKFQYVDAIAYGGRLK
jgi:hypothetical protein